MPIQFVKNIQFSRLIKTEGRLREFNFRKTGTGNEEKCSVDTVDDRGNRIIFAMLRENGTWKLSSTLLPKWICQYEEQLNEAIEDEISHQ
ncbi:MAG TPA: hypothetical protein VFO37_08550 [Chitinophagaceae bacterium]|jgi:hypothetical protein|nr:hypothetical protein [Chitinophagaceae bacterium]